MAMAGCYRTMASFNGDLSAVIRAANFAAIKHRDQKRKDGKTPYINHPVGVANLIVELGKVTDPVILQAAILHDTVEDTATTFEELEQHFGTKVRNVVAEVTDDRSLSKLERKSAQLKKAPTLTYEARVVKLADKLYNLRDTENFLPHEWTPDYRDFYVRWCYDVVGAIRGTNAGLEAALDEYFQGYKHLF